MTLNLESSAVQTHITNLQGIIARMSQLSANTKTWCITVIAAIFVISTNLTDLSVIWVSIVPLFLFLVMDMQYLALERRFRDMYDDFISGLHKGEVTEEMIFVIKPWDDWQAMLLHFFKAFFSFAIIPFYGLLLFLIALIDSLYG